MANVNDFKPFATAANANVTEQTAWEALPAVAGGFSSGKASSAQVNKGLRQGTSIAALIGQFIANSGVDALDDGDISSLVTKFTNAIITNLGVGTAAKLAAPTATLNSSSGYFSLPVIRNGAVTNLIVQFGGGGVDSTSGGSVWTRTLNNFIIPFPNACLSVIAVDSLFDMPATFTPANNSSAGRVVVGALGSSYLSKTGFSALGESAFNWLAIGY